MLARVGSVLRAALATGALVAGFSGSAAQAQESACTKGDGAQIVKVCYNAVPGAAVYGHNILGNTPEWNTLTVHWGPEAQARRPARGATTVWSESNHIFEDVAPRLVDLDKDGMLDIVTVQSSFQQGARLLILHPRKLDFGPVGTRYIGQRNRWLAPIGIEDFDRDGKFELAYIDRPHLAKTLRIWRYSPGRPLEELAARAGLTNHRIGEPDIGGGVRDCGRGPEMIVATGNWTNVIGIKLLRNGMQTADLGPYEGRSSFAAAMACR
jgi:hypothetical protein